MHVQKGTITKAIAHIPAGGSALLSSTGLRGSLAQEGAKGVEFGEVICDVFSAWEMARLRMQARNTAHTGPDSSLCYSRSRPAERHGN